MKRFRRVILSVGVGIVAILIYGWHKEPPKPAPSSAFWKQPIPAQTVHSSPQYATAIAEARSSILERMQYFGTPGAAVAVAVRQEIVWSECFGYADIARKVMVNSDTKFRVGSVSKPFTAAAIARLFEQGKIDLDAPAFNYLPNFSNKRPAFSVRQLAAHLAGFGSERSRDFVNTRHYNSVAEAIAEFQDDPLAFPPGVKFNYSGRGYTLLSAIIENVHHRDFLSAMDALVFHPLEMTNTSADLPTATNVTVFYDNYSKAGKMPEVATHHDHSRSWAAGGFLSTPLDLIRFGNAHLTNGFLTPETISTFFESQKTAAGEETGYGLGWSVAVGSSGLRQVQHLGDTVGGQAFLVLYPELDLVIALVCTGNFWNYHGDGSSGATDRLAQIFIRDIQRNAKL
jgi:serine beta-lactamase-like protein LACTB